MVQILHSNWCFHLWYLKPQTVWLKSSIQIDAFIYDIYNHKQRFKSSIQIDAFIYDTYNHKQYDSNP